MTVTIALVISLIFSIASGLKEDNKNDIKKENEKTYAIQKTQSNSRDTTKH